MSTPRSSRQPEPLLCRTEGLHWRLVDGEMLLLDEHSGRYLTLNGSGALLWELLVTGATREQLAERLVTEFGIERPQADRDVDALLGELASRGLLAAGPPSPLER